MFVITISKKKVYSIIIGLFIIILLSYPGNAKVIEFKEQYQDYLGNWYSLDNFNIFSHPFYFKTENATHYNIQRMDDSFTINKNLVYNGSFNFRPTDISFTIITPASKVAQISQANGTGQRRIKIPESAKQTYKRFEWDHKLPTVIISNQTWDMTVLESDYWYSKQNGNLWFNFKIANVTGLPADVTASFYFTSWNVTNATTSGWTTSNITLVNVTRDLSSGNVTAGNLWDTFDDDIIASSWTKSGGTVTESNGIMNVTGTGASSHMIITPPYIDNFNVTVDIKTIQNGTVQDYYVPWLYVLTTNVDANRSHMFLRVTNISALTLYYISTAIGNVSSTAIANRYLMNTFKVYTSGNLMKAYINNTLDRTLNHVNVSNLKTVPSLTTRLAAVSASGNTTIGHFDNFRMWQNNTGNMYIWKETASPGFLINRTRLVLYIDSNNTIDLYAKQNGSSSWTLVQANVQNNTWMNLTSSAIMDFNIRFNGNDSISPIFSSLEWDENSRGLRYPAVAVGAAAMGTAAVIAYYTWRRRTRPFMITFLYMKL